MRLHDISRSAPICDSRVLVTQYGEMLTIEMREGYCFLTMLFPSCRTTTTSLGTKLPWLLHMWPPSSQGSSVISKSSLLETVGGRCRHSNSMPRPSSALLSPGFPRAWVTAESYDADHPGRSDDQSIGARAEPAENISRKKRLVLFNRTLPGPNFIQRQKFYFITKMLGYLFFSFTLLHRAQTMMVPCRY